MGLRLLGPDGSAENVIREKNGWCNASNVELEAQPTINPIAAALQVLDDVQNCEEKHPDDIDEVPVKARALKEPVFLRCYMPHHRLYQRGDQEENTDQHMAAVESGEHEETGTHNAGSIKPETFMVEMSPLERLIGKEQRAEHDRGQQQEFAAFTSFDQRGLGKMQRKTAADQEDRSNDRFDHCIAPF